jgi:hypothetical protein
LINIWYNIYIKGKEGIILMIQREIGEMRSESMKKVINYFTNTAARGSASDIGVSGSFMTSLCRRGYMQVVDTESKMVLIDEYRRLYKEVEINIYAPRGSVARLYVAYADSINKLANEEKSKAETMLECAQNRLRDVQNLISRIDFVNPSN